jgi:hypothetical protein
VKSSPCWKLWLKPTAWSSRDRRSIFGLNAIKQTLHLGTISGLTPASIWTFWGGRSDVLRCGEALNADPFFPLPSENTANSGKIVTQLEGAEFEIDFLHSPNGLSPAEVRELAPVIFFENISLKVLHPLHCVESKTVNLATLPQNTGERQDLKHLRLSMCASHFLAAP